jgi:NAD(P)-dependent dehydrogenase (short-subunit alcohol dehydrogenase family)
MRKVVNITSISGTDGNPGQVGYSAGEAACPLGWLGTPDDAAGTVLFFCSPVSDYVTGEVLICSGGLHF